MADVHPTRAFLSDAHRIIIKFGTAVVSRGIDGRLAIGRLGSLFEQIESLLRKGKEVILVTSGAVGVGRQKLRHQKLMSSSMKDLEEARSMDMDSKACASIGQSGLMALYDALFGQLDVASSQLLVTDSDFRNPDFRKQLRSTVDSLLKNKVIPVFNENDAISTRTAPYKDSTGIFWDNDSLAALLSLELRVDALILMSDVDGLYTGPPSKPGSKIIHTYLKEKHDEMVTFGEKSRVGRGGMMAKVEAAWMAASAGVPVVIASGYISNNLVNVFEGKLVGTLFHKDAPNWETKQNETSRVMALNAREASRKLQALPSASRKKILYDIAAALELHEQEIIEENNADVKMAEITGISPSLLQRLKLKPGKIAQLAQGIRSIADMEEPMGETLKMTELTKGLVLEKQTWPLGVLLVIFEARPDALPQIASLAIRSGNGLLLKGGKEASRSNAIIHKVITDAIPPNVGKGLIGLITTREEISDLLKLDDVIDLVIPRGSNELVSHIKQNTKIAVLGHADGVCHIYVDEDFDYDMALKIILDAKLDYPAACNAVETLLIHGSLQESGELQKLLHALHENGIYVYGGEKSSSTLNLPHAPSLHYEYGCPALTLEIVGNIEEAIEYIHAHGSGHTESIITNNKITADLFLNAVDSAVVMHNSSTRFSDGFRFGLGAEVGISTSRIHARGPVGVEGLLTSKWIVRGHGHIVNKDKDINYTHKNLPVVKSHLNGHCSQRDMYHSHSS